MKQSCLKGLFAGRKVRAPEPPPKRPVGRPPKVRVEDLPPPGEDIVALRKEDKKAIEVPDEEAHEASHEEASEGRGKEAEEVEEALVEATLASDETQGFRKRQWSIEEFREAGKEGAAFGRLGGRPRKALRLVEENTGALVPHEGPVDRAEMRVTRRERDDTFGPTAKASLVRVWKKMREERPDKDEVLLAELAAQTRRPKKMLRLAIEGGDKWDKMLEKKAMHHQGVLMHEARKPRYMRQRSCNYKTMMRAPGAGRKGEVDFLHSVVERWFDSMREGCHHVDKEDLLTEFKRIAKLYLARLEGKKEHFGELSYSDKKRQAALEDKLATLEKHPHAQRYMRNKLQGFMQARLLKPQRVMNLSPSEEYRRAVST